MTKTLAVIQSHYVPWAGFFDLICGCTDVVLLDSVQFSKNSFFNRNQLQGPNGNFWITIPIKTQGKAGQAISEVEIEGSRWIKKHLSSLEQSLNAAPFFKDCWDVWQQAYRECLTASHLSKVNRIWLKCILQQLKSPVRLHEDFHLIEPERDKNSRLISLCKSVGATTYRTGPKGLDYLDGSRFVAESISVEVIEYGNYYPYRTGSPNLHKPVSMLDNLANLGSNVNEIFHHSFRSAN